MYLHVSNNLMMWKWNHHARLAFDTDINFIGPTIAKNIHLFFFIRKMYKTSVLYFFQIYWYNGVKDIQQRHRIRHDSFF